VHGVRGIGTRYGRAQLDRLIPGTTYHYQVEVDGTLGPAGQVRTAPTASKPFVFTAFGDEGTTPAASPIVQQVASHAPAFHLVSGDLCYADLDGQGLPTDRVHPSVWDGWLRQIEPVAATTPWMTAVGNHEMEPGHGPQGYDGYLARFPLPGTGPDGCPASYHFRYGSAAFVQVDSNDASYEIPANLDYTGGRQTNWLTDVLETYRADPTIDFVVVTMHHCAYSTADSHGSEGGVRERWVPLFDRYAVDLVLSGHNHAYERTHPLRNGLPVAMAPPAATVSSDQGTTYLLVGGGGATLAHGFTPGRTQTSRAEGVIDHDSATFSSVRALDHCYLTANVTPGSTEREARMELSVRNAGGRELDSVTLTRPSSAPASGSGSSGRLIAGGVGAGVVLGGAAAGGVLVHRRRRDAPVRPTDG
jgi:hypothetical protein